MQLTYVLCSVMATIGATCSGQCSEEHVALVQRTASHLSMNGTKAFKAAECNLNKVWETGCPDGMPAITDAAACEACVQGLQHDYRARTGDWSSEPAGVNHNKNVQWRGTGNWADDVPGCYLNIQANDIYFNVATGGRGWNYMIPVCGTAKPSVSAVGDPHLVNSLGEHFSIFRAGQMEFVRVPYESTTEEAEFTVHAKLQTFGETTDKCKEAQYITGLIFGGSRFKGKPLEVDVDFIHPGATRKEMKVLLGGVPVMASTDPIDVGTKMTLEMHDNAELVLKVDEASVAVHLQYYFLNVEANSFSKLAPRIGGLLGEDDHATFSMKPAGCEREIQAKAALTIFSSGRMTP